VPIQTTSAARRGPFRRHPPRQYRREVRRRLQGRGRRGLPGRQPEGRITTLGRGGSDTTAVAFAAAFGAERCDIYTDVDGVYTTDPRIAARRASWTRSLRGNAGTGLAGRQGAADPLGRTGHALQGAAARAVIVRGYRRNSGTLVCDEEEIMESKVVSGVAFSRDEAKITLFTIEDRPGIAAAIFGPLADAGVNVDMIVQNISEKDYDDAHPGAVTDMTFSCPINQVERARRRWKMPRPRA
jgi:aspartate kinase